MRNKVWSICWEVLSVTWPNFTIVKCTSKISIIYHQIKIYNGIMNRSSIKKLFLKSSQYSQKTPALESRWSLEDILEDEKLLPWRRIEDVFRTYLEDIFKTSWRPTNVCWVSIICKQSTLNYRHRGNDKTI